MDETKIASYPYPTYLDPPDGGGQTRLLAEAVERDVMLKFADAEARNAVVDDPEPGMLAYLTASKTITRYSNGEWKVFSPTPPAPVWHPLPFYTGWRNYDADPASGWGDCFYTKDAAGFVWLKGLAYCDASSAEPVTLLPAGFRPPAGLAFVNVGHPIGQARRINVLPDGAVAYDYFDRNPMMSLDCICFATNGPA